ncbi:MAG: hypothetical protein EBQ77_02770 [Sphingobacteriia bacterium]|jgi:hypothetical protein|nr:hypothetical protein [Sphingobacteriia bacterium]
MYRGIYVFIIGMCYNYALAQQLQPRLIDICKKDTTLLSVRCLDKTQNCFAASTWIWQTPRGTIEQARTLKIYEAGWFKLFIYQNLKLQWCDSVYVKGYVHELPKDTILCGTVLTFSPSQGIVNLWNVKSEIKDLQIRNSGIYSIEIQKGRCRHKDTIHVSIKPKPQQQFYTQQFCDHDSSKRIGPAQQSNWHYLWSTGSRSAQIDVQHNGLYVLQMYKPRECKLEQQYTITIKTCPCRLNLPSTIYPKSKVYFYIQPACPITMYRLSISDMFGNLIFQTQRITEVWDGTYKGSTCPEGLYQYELVTADRDGKKIRNGKIKLVY